MSNTEDLQRWSRQMILNIVESLGVDAGKAQYEISEPSKTFISVLWYACVKYKNDTKENEELSMILKRAMSVNEANYVVNVRSQFHNEVIFYQMYARPDENFPRCFYANNRDLVIALENVNKHGYCECPYKYDAPLEYVLAAMHEMGRFHGKGYVMKEQRRDEFFDIVERIEETRYDIGQNDFRPFLEVTSTRAVEYLRRRGYDRVFCDKMESLLVNAFDEVMVKTVKPTEPLSTICHGDFTLDNTFFKVEPDGRIRVMLIDFGLLRYGTPVIDLSTFLYLCCSNELRKDKFNEIFGAYYDALRTYLLEAGVQNMEKYSYDVLLNDYKRGSLFGFVITTFYMPTLMGVYKADFEKAMAMGPKVNGQKCKESGGDEVSKILADMLLDLRDLGCLEHVL